MWTDDIVDPEFIKNVQILSRLIDGAIGIWERANSGEGGSVAATRQELVARSEHLKHLVALPDKVPLTLEELLCRRFELEQLLLDVGDDKYVAKRADELFGEEEGGTLITWKELYGDVAPPLVRHAGGDAQDDQAREDANGDSRASGWPDCSLSRTVDICRCGQGAI